MKLIPYFSLIVLLCGSLTIAAQKKAEFDFNKITEKDFSLEGIKVDTSYGAVIIADVGNSSFIGNRKGYFTIVYKHQRRIKVISAKGFDIATVNIPLYKSSKTNDEETLESLKASTYNLVDGKVVETKLNKDDVFKEVSDRNHSVRKFTMPAVKEGSIIEYSYTVNSDFLFNLQPWSFQGAYPRLWSEYQLNLPSFFSYVFLAQGYHPFFIRDTKEKQEYYSVIIPAQNLDRGVAGRDEIYNLKSTNTISKWVMKDVPAIKEESFTSTLDNHIAKIQFQMTGQQFPDMPYRDIMGSWQKLTEELMKDEDFGFDFSRDNNWLSSTLKNLALEDKDYLEKTKTIYAYVQQNFSCSGQKNIYLSQSLKETLRSKKGYVADLNLLLCLMLKQAGLTTNPVILSTRKNGIPTDSYPLIGQYNYVVTKVKIGSDDIYLDASNRKLGFNKLEQFCYNGSGRSIDPKPVINPLYPENITEAKVTNIVLSNDKGDKNKWSGMLNSYLGYYESLNIREEVEEKGKEAYVNKLKESYTGSYKIDDVKLNDFDNNDKVIMMNYALEIDREGDNQIIYFNPMIKEGIKENYFKSTERLYPVELPYKMEETYLFKMDIPEGYEIDEAPKSTKVSFNDNEGIFEYIISKTDKDISLLSKISIQKTIFIPEDYESLKNFFDYIVKKHAEQIVFKKK